MRVFVSYDTRDESFATDLRKRLGELGMKVWNPADELYPGSNWLLETGKALERADAVVFLLSSKFSRSKWTQFEMQYVLTRPLLADRVFPVILDSRARVPWSMRRFSIHAEEHDAAKVAGTIGERLKKSAPLRLTTSRRVRSSAKSVSQSVHRASAAKVARTR
jgi:hypothetical protein